MDLKKRKVANFPFLFIKAEAGTLVAPALKYDDTWILIWK